MRIWKLNGSYHSTCSAVVAGNMGGTDTILNLGLLHHVRLHQLIVQSLMA